MASLGCLLARSEELTEIDPEGRYRQVTVKLWGKGVELREEVDGTEVTASKMYVVRAKQFILSKIDARNGAFGLIPPSLDGAIVSTDFPVFTTDSSRLLPEFLDWISKTPDFVNLCVKASEGTTNRIRLKVDRFLAAQIPLPSLDEQRRIVTCIERFAAKIEEARGLHTRVEEDAHGLLLSEYHRIITGAQEFPMGCIAPLVRRPVEVELSDRYYELGIRSFGKGTFHKSPVTGAELGTKRIFRIKQHDLLFNIVFAWEGAVAVAKPEDDGRVGSHRFLTCVPEEGVVRSSFLCFHFLTERGLEQLLHASPGSAGRNRTLGLQALEQMMVPVPLYEHQLWFERLQSQLESASQIRRSNEEELVALLPSILDKAFKGEL
jgi:type I restriction enzyme S subunit